MPLEKGGRADKAGNRFEIRCIVYEILKIIRELNYSVVIEALGDDEKGTDILITKSNGTIEHQQCKVCNASKEKWTFLDLKSRDIISNWKFQLNRDKDRQVSLVSSLGCRNMVDLHERAMNTNGKPKDFYKYQIETSSKEFRDFYQDFCNAMELNFEDEGDILKSIDFLQRISFKQISDYYLKENIYQGIEYYFLSEKEKVYDSLISLIVDGDILGREITASVLMNYFNEQNIRMRLLEGDKRLTPIIKRINQEYRKNFKSLKEGLIGRSEFQTCIGMIKHEQSFIISGAAGSGKSGCTEAILNYCEKEEVPYIALKLDRKIPHGSCEIWGNELGLNVSISYAIHAISQNTPAVIVLDQLDALRWTQANSNESISVCTELIRQVDYLNFGREKKIIIVFVCREYDLQNDNNIRLLFEKEKNNAFQKEWEKVIIKNFDESIVKSVVGKLYDSLAVKIKKLLRKPSNLYIWQHLNEGEVYDDCTTASHLIEKWIEQIYKRCFNFGVEEENVKNTLEQIVENLDRLGRLYVPKPILNIGERGYDYLVSEEIIIQDGNRVGFVHQSILDYLISKRMILKYYEGVNVEAIIGGKNKQTPGRRYQIHMFLQNLLEYDSADFLSAGVKILESEQIRYFIKYVFYEILGQTTEPDERISEFIAESCRNEDQLEHMLNNVIYGRKQYIVILRERGFLEQWFSDEKKKSTVFILLKSISLDLDNQDILFIKQRAFIREEDDKQFAGCLWHDITQESDELFELRMLFYNKYPDWARELYIDIKSMLKHSESRLVRLMSFWLKNKIKSKGESVYRYEEEFLDEENEYLIENASFVLDELLQYIPEENSVELQFGDWSGRYFHKRGLERAAISMIKKANKAIINKNPELFWRYYIPYMGKGYPIFNEIILQGFQFLPLSYSDKIISYLASDLDKNIFDLSSDASEQLGLVKEVIRIHTVSCSKECLAYFWETVEKYSSPRAVEWYKERHHQYV